MTESLPRESAGDDLHRVVRAILSAAPLVGGAAVELLCRLLAPPIQKRRDAWLNNVGERIMKLEQNGRVNIDGLQKNDEFVSTIMQASQAAICNHQQEKLDALRNAVLNTALGQAPEDSKRETFVSFIDTISVWHIRLLALLSSPVEWFESHEQPVPDYRISSSLHGIVREAMPELAVQGDYLEFIVADLTQRKLVSGGGIMTVMSADGWKAKRTTDLGDEFLQFISEPQVV